jgi:hypothetical protein
MSSLWLVSRVGEGGGQLWSSVLCVAAPCKANWQKTAVIPLMSRMYQSWLCVSVRVRAESAELPLTIGAIGAYLSVECIGHVSV